MSLGRSSMPSCITNPNPSKSPQLDQLAALDAKHRHGGPPDRLLLVGAGTMGVVSTGRNTRDSQRREVSAQ